MKLKDPSKLSADDMAGLAYISHKTTKHSRYVRVRMHDKVKALEQLGKHLGMFKD